MNPTSILHPLAIVGWLGVLGLQVCNPDPIDGVVCAPWSPHAASGKHCKSTQDIEPNDNTSQANTLDAGTCAPQTVKGELAGDVDVFRSRGVRCQKSPSVVAKLDSPAQGVRLCVFVACRNGKTWLLGCPEGTSSRGTDCKQLPEGMLGCCRQGEGEVNVLAQCDGDNPLSFIDNIDTELNAYIVVDRTDGATTCLPYELHYHF